MTSGFISSPIRGRRRITSSCAARLAARGGYRVDGDGREHELRGGGRQAGWGCHRPRHRDGRRAYQRDLRRRSAHWRETREGMVKVPPRRQRRRQRECGRGSSTVNMTAGTINTMLLSANRDARHAGAPDRDDRKGRAPRCSALPCRAGSPPISRPERAPTNSAWRHHATGGRADIGQSAHEAWRDRRPAVREGDDGGAALAERAGAELHSRPVSCAGPLRPARGDDLRRPARRAVGRPSRIAAPHKGVGVLRAAGRRGGACARCTVLDRARHGTLPNRLRRRHLQQAAMLPPTSRRSRIAGPSSVPACCAAIDRSRSRSSWRPSRSLSEKWPRTRAGGAALTAGLGLAAEVSRPAGDPALAARCAHLAQRGALGVPAWGGR